MSGPSKAAWLAGALAAVAFGNGLHAQPPHAQPNGELSVPRFHRNYVPAEQIENGAWTEGYLPIDADEFRRLVETVHAGAIGAPGAKAARIEEAEYRAQLVGDNLLVGSATLRLSRREPTNVMLMLDPCSLALAAADWQDQDSKPAVLGVGPDGLHYVLVEGSRLHLDWSLRAARTASGGVGFRIEVPRCPITRVTFDAPAELEFVVDSGIIGKAAGPTPETTRWTIELGGYNRTTLRAVVEGAARERPPLTLLRQSLTYDFSARGVNVGAQLKLDVHGEPLKRIAVELDPGLRVVAARYGELQVPFAVIDDVETGTSHVELRLPEPIVGTGRVLQFSAIAPLALGTRWRLPGLRPEGMAWQEGTATLLIPGDLVLKQLNTDGCRESRMAALPARAGGESIEIQYFRPDATVEVLLDEPREELRLDSGSLVEVGPNEITSRQSVEVGIARGERRVVHARAAAPWTIDTIADVGTNESLEWEIEDGPDGASLLKIALAATLSPGQRARFVVRGHRPVPPGSSFEAQELVMLDFDPAPGGERLIAVRGAEGMELRWAEAADSSRLDPLKLTAAQTRLLPQPTAGVLFDADALFVRSTVGVERRKASYAVDIRIDAVLQDDVLTETYTFECVPETSRIDRLLVRLSQPRDAPLEWNLAGANSGQFAARRITPAEQTQVGLPEGGEAWEITLQLAHPGAFGLRAVRSTRLDDATPLALASVAQATLQRGTVTIRALGGSGVTIKNRRLASVPAELLETDRYQTTRAAFDYQPGRDDLGAEPAVSVAPAKPEQATSGAWIWNLRLDSRFRTAGATVHWARLGIQTAGKQSIHITLPEGAQLQAAWMDEQLLSLSGPSADESGYLVDLPPGRAFASLSLYYTTSGRLPSLVASTEPAFPRFDIPIMARQWTLWLPPGYEIGSSPGEYPVDSLAPVGLTERLFGGLGREATSKTFNPFIARDWQSLIARDSDDLVARQSAKLFVETLGAMMTAYVAGEAETDLTWGQLLALAAADETSSGRTVLIDGDSLAWLNLGPQTRVRFQPGDSPLGRGVALLRSADLAVLARPDVIAVTSGATAAAEARQLGGCDYNVVYSVASGPLADEFERAAARPGSGSDYQAVASWQAAPQRGPLPWSQPEQAKLATQDAGAWQPYTLHLSHAGQPRIPIVHTAAMNALAWPVFLVVVAAGIWRRDRRPTMLLIFGALSGVLAALLPAAYVPLASAAFLGALVCVALRMTRMPLLAAHAGDERSHASHSKLDVAHQVAVWLLVAAILHCGTVRLAAQPRPATSPLQSTRTAAESPSASSDSEQRSADAGARPAQRIHQVFVPVDDEQNPIDGRYYVPAELYNQLLRRARAASGGSKEWLVTGASYQGTLARDPITRQLGLSQLKAVILLQVWQSRATVMVPFPREAGSDPVVGARLDGRAIPVTWNDAGDALVIGTLPADRYRLELDLQTRQQTYGTTAGFDLAIPPLASAEIELAIPPDAPAIELPVARGQVRVQKDRGRLQAQLGACRRLSVRWPAGIGMETSIANAEVEELIWIKVRPGTTVVHARFKYRVLEGSMRQIRLLVDPRLRLLPSTSVQSPIAAVQTIAGDPQRIDLELARPVSDQIDVDLSFLLTGASGVGNLQFPRLESRAARATRRCLAVSVDVSLESREFPGEDCRPMAIGEFMTAWGAADNPPLAAYRIPRGQAMWVLATQPSEPRTAVEQTLAVSLGRGPSLVEYDAALSIERGYLFQLGLKGPPGLSIDDISLVEDDLERIARWSVDEVGRITVFLTGPITGKQRLTLRGHIESTASGAATLPIFEMVGVESASNRWLVYRQSAVLVEVDPGPDVTSYEPDDAQPRDGFGTLVGAYQSDDPQAAIAVRVSPNAAQASALTVTTLERDDDRWIAELLCRVTVSEGVVDVLTFDVSPQWAEPFRVDPPAQTKVVPVPGEQRLQLVVYPPRPIADTYQLRIRGRVALSAGDRLRVPDIVPQRMQQVDRFVVLPQRLDLQQISWETIGLVRAPMPDEFAARVPNSESAAVFQVEGERFQASLKGVRRAAAEARVRVADIHVVCQPDGRCQGVASFDLEPAGATSCVLELSPGYQLLHASLDSIPAQLHLLGDNRWRLTLGPQELPRRLEVVYNGPVSTTADDTRFDAPRLLDLVVDETLWTVYAPRDTRMAPRNDAVPTVTAAQQELHRLRSIAALALLPAEILGERLPEEVARWYRPWKHRYSVSRADLDWALAIRGQDNTQSAEAIEARQLNEKIRQLDARLGAPASGARRTSHFTLPAELLSASRATFQPTRYIARGDAHTLNLRYPQARGAGWTARITFALTLVVVVGVAIFMLRDHKLPKASPGIVIATVGVAWWLLLTPSFVGLVAMAVGALTALRGRGQIADTLVAD